MACVSGVQPERIRHAEPGLSQQSGPVHSSDAVLNMLHRATAAADRLEGQFRQPRGVC